LSDSPINWFAEKNAMSSLDVALPKMTSCRVGNETREGREGRAGAAEQRDDEAGSNPNMVARIRPRKTSTQTPTP